MQYNYIEDSMTIGKTEYSLAKYRRWLLNEYPELCQGHFIKAIQVNGKTTFTYDWMSVYQKARDFNIHFKFIKHEVSS